MFTGIIETVGIVHALEKSGTNLIVYIKSPLYPQLKIDQSIAHNGVCLTVDRLEEEGYRCTVIDETLSKTNFKNLKLGDRINLERCVLASSRMDGHFVQGHVDTSIECINKKDLNGSWQFSFPLPEQYYSLVVPQGSISINGVSLTISHLLENSFAVSIIPYTYSHTNFSQLNQGDLVNIEFDILGKYIQRNITVNKKKTI